MEVNRAELINSLGGEEAVKRMDHEARADALEDYLTARLESVVAERLPKSEARFLIIGHA